LELRGNSENNPENNTHIIIRHDGELHSICARKVGDMVEVPSQSMEKEPGHLDPSLKRVLDGLFRFNDHVLHCLNLSQLLKTKDTAREQS
jgi:chemotaxis signal transduction protein